MTNKTQIEFVYNDGGRESSGFKGEAKDCVCRAISIATGKDYKEVYSYLAEQNQKQRKTKTTPSGLARKKTARNGIQTKRKWFKQYMESLGFIWVPCMSIGSGCKVHLRASELPKGILIVSLSRHMACVKDRILHDTHDCSKGGTRCVYGYWKYKNE
jgi:hypothetical protein